MAVLDTPDTDIPSRKQHENLLLFVRKITLSCLEGFSYSNLSFPPMVGP
jgi:hypothetical protein